MKNRLGTLLAATGVLLLGTPALAESPANHTVQLMDAGAKSASLSTSDTQFLHRLARMDMQEIALCQLALDRSSSTPVRAVAQTILRDDSMAAGNLFNLASANDWNVGLRLYGSVNQTTIPLATPSSPIVGNQRVSANAVIIPNGPTSPASSPLLAVVPPGAFEMASPGSGQPFHGTIELPNPTGADNAGFGRGTHNGYNFGSSGLGLNGGYDGGYPPVTAQSTDLGDRPYNHFTVASTSSTPAVALQQVDATIEIPMDPGFSQFRSLKGVAFDRAFVRYELAHDASSMALLRREATAGENADLRSMATRQLPMMAAHRQALLDLQASM